MAAAEADRWLETLDPATLPLAVIPRGESEEEFGCPYSTKCRVNAPPVSHAGFVTDCADARCRACPEIFGELVSHLIYKSWCSYVCVRTGVSPPPVVAIGIGVITYFKKQFDGPYCLSR